MENEENYELQPNFDPNKLKIAELRGLLFKYDVLYNSAAKKSDLVKSFQVNIASRAPELLRVLAEIRPSDVGILDGESQDGSLAELDTDSGEDQQQQEEIVPKKSGRKSLIKPKATPRKSTASTSTAIGSKKGKQVDSDSDEDVDSDSDEDQEEEPQVVKKSIKGKQSLGTQEVKTASGSSKRRLGSAGPEEHKRLKGESSSPEKDQHASLKYESGPESGFSDFNPFQSGGEDSPNVKTSRRKSSMGPVKPRIPSGMSGRKSLPAPKSNWNEDDHETTGVASSSPFRSTPQASTSSHYQQPFSSHVDSPSVQQQQQFINNGPTLHHSASSSNLVPVKYMVPIEKVKRSPPEVVEMQRKLGLFEQEDRDREDRLRTAALAKEEEEEREAELEREEREREEERAETPPILLPPTPIRNATPKRRSMAGGVEGVGKKELRKTPAVNRVVGKGRSLDQNQVTKFNSNNQLVPSITTTSTRTSTISVLSLIFSLILYLLYYREETIAAGFCDTSSSTNSQIVSRSSSPIILSFLPAIPPSLISLIDTLHLRPNCTPCPAHARCSNGLILACEREYVLKSHPLSFGGLIPISPKCQPDTMKLMNVAEGASRASRILRVRRGEVICQGLEKARKSKNGVGRGSGWIYGIEVSSLSEAIKKEFERSGSSLSDESIDEIISLALADLESHEEVITEIIDDVTWYAAKTGDMSLTCRARIATVNQAEKHKTELSGLFALLLASLWMKSKYQSRKAEQIRVSALVQTALQLLRDQERLHHTDAVLAPTSSVAASHLRDLVLQNEHSLPKRKYLWNQVERVVEGNSNVRAKQVELNGEEVRAWEWTGAARVSWEGNGVVGRLSEGDNDTKKLYPEL